MDCCVSKPPNGRAQRDFEDLYLGRYSAPYARLRSDTHFHVERNSTEKVSRRRESLYSKLWWLIASARPKSSMRMTSGRKLWKVRIVCKSISASATRVRPIAGDRVANVVSRLRWISGFCCCFGVPYVGEVSGESCLYYY